MKNSFHMIMSGRTVWHLPMAPFALQKGLCPPDLEQQTIPAVFNRAGYATMRNELGREFACSENIDLQIERVLATLCDLAGIEAPRTNEGISFKPVLQGREAAVRDVLYGVYSGGTKPGMRSVKRGDWKLIKYDVLDGKVRETQLFNVADNPEEYLEQHQDPAVVALTGHRPSASQRNLGGDPRHAAKLAEMEALLLGEMRRLHDPYRLWNQPGDGLQPPPEPAAKKKSAAKN